MDPLKNYDECVEIETARCARRQACIGEGSFNEEFPNFDYDTCVAYAGEFCRTREIGGVCPLSSIQFCVDLCVEAIEIVDCDILQMNYNETVDLPDCDFLTSEEEDPDAGTTSDAG